MQITAIKSKNWKLKLNFMQEGNRISEIYTMLKMPKGLLV